MSETPDHSPSPDTSHPEPTSTPVVDAASSAKGDTSGAIPPVLAAAIACALPVIGSIAMLVLERENRFVRFYAMQSLVFGLAWIVLGIALMIASVILGLIPILGPVLAVILGILSSLLFLVLLVIWVFQIYKAFTGAEWEMPFLGPIARNLQEGKTPLGPTGS